MLCFAAIVVFTASMSAMERTELKMAVIAEQLGLSWAGNLQHSYVHYLCGYVPGLVVLVQTSFVKMLWFRRD